MYRLAMKRFLSSVLFVGVLLAVPGALAADDETSPKAKTLTDVGMDLEWARLRAPSERPAALEAVATSVDDLMHRGIAGDKRAAAYFLSGEVQFLAGDYVRAAKEFEEAVKRDRKSPFADDAQLSEIRAIEAQGRDLDAAKEWKKWQKHHADSPLMPEALLAMTWNALRRDSLSEATGYLADLRKGYSYLEHSPTVVLAGATIAYRSGDPSGALAMLESTGDGVSETFLRALAYEASAQMLKAAAQYQSVVERFPTSKLHDYAMLAKANIFLLSGAYRSAAEEFERVAGTVQLAQVRAEAELRRAACVFLDGDAPTGTDLLHQVVSEHAGTDVAARAQLLLGEVLVSQGMYEEAILEFNHVLTEYFEHELAASAQYRVGRCLDALDRRNEATSAYQLVVSGYPLAPQAPAAAYLAGVGLLDQNRPQAAIPYFQLVLDRYALDQGDGTLVFESPQHQELVEAALCLLELSYHRVGNMGQLCGVPHMMLQKMPPSSSTWRAYALLIDADALAAQARHEESQTVLETLITEFPEHDVGVAANRLLAWTYAQQGKDELAIQTEERMLARYASEGNTENLSSAYLNKAHILFNRKQYEEAAATYDDFLARFPEHPNRLLALYQSGLCHMRLDRKGNAVDRWEELVASDPSAEIAERAWVRAGDTYFQAEHYDDAKRCYQGLLDNFANSRGAALGMLRMAQCDYNAGRDAEALESFSQVTQRFPGTGIAREAERGMERALYRLGQRADGVEVLAELVAKYPTSSFAADAQFEIAMRQYDGGQFLEAAESFRRVVSQFPSYSEADRAHFLMSDAYAQAGSMDDAKTAYEQFLLFFPESKLRTTVRFRLASQRFDDGDYMRAAIDFTTVMEEDPPADMAKASLFNLALCRRMLGDTQASKTLLEQYRDTYNGDDRAAQVAYYLGDIQEKSGNLDVAAAEYQRALKAKPEKALETELYYRIGTCSEQAEKTADAINYYQKAMAAKDKSDAFRLSAVARCAALYEKQKNYKKALVAYRDLIKNAKDPDIVVAAQERASQLEDVVK